MKLGHKDFPGKRFSSPPETINYGCYWFFFLTDFICEVICANLQKCAPVGYLVLQSTWYSSSPGTLVHLVLQSTWYSSSPGTLVHLVLQSAWYFSQPGIPVHLVLLPGPPCPSPFGIRVHQVLQSEIPPCIYLYQPVTPFYVDTLSTLFTLSQKEWEFPQTILALMGGAD